MKTDEMNDKIDAIDINAISKKIPEDCKILVIKVKDKLTEFSKNANFFKELQKIASNMKKLFKKSGQLKKNYVLNSTNIFYLKNSKQH